MTPNSDEEDDGSQKGGSAMQSIEKALARSEEDGFNFSLPTEGRVPGSTVGFGRTSSPFGGNAAGNMGGYNAKGYDYARLKTIADGSNNPVFQAAVSAMGPNGLTANTAEGVKKLQEMGINTNMAWCTQYVNASARLAGYEGSHSDMARSFLDPKFRTTKPQVGDLVIFDRNHDGTSGHVGFYVGTDEKTGNVIVLGGNQGGGNGEVSVAAFNPGAILGFAHLPEKVHTPTVMAAATTAAKTETVTTPPAAAAMATPKLAAVLDGPRPGAFPLS